MTSKRDLVAAERTLTEFNSVEPLAETNLEPHERGAVLMLLAILMFVIMVSGALAVDISALERRGQTLQNIADAAALGASTTWVSTGDQMAATEVMMELFDQNGLDIASSDVSAQISFPSDNEVEVTLIDSSPDVYLAGILGFGSSLERDASAELVACDSDCGIDVELGRPFSSLTALGNGDGYRPISVGNRLYGINHHGTDISCIDRITLSGCFAPRSAFPSSSDAISDQLVTTATVGTRIWWTAQERTRLALFCWETVTETPCSTVRTVQWSTRADHLGDQYRQRGGGMAEFGGRLFVFTDDHRVHCFDPGPEQFCPGYPQSTDLAGSVNPWNPYYEQTGSGIDRIVDKESGRIYYAMRARESGGGVQEGTWLDCWNASTNSKCASFTPNRIHASGNRRTGRLFFYHNTQGDIEGVCSTGISEITCTDLNGNDASWLESALFDLEQNLPQPSDYSKAHGTHMYHPPTNRLFLTKPRWMSTITCWDFTTQSMCGTLYGSQNGMPTSDYGFIYEDNCLFALGHTSIFWSFTADLEPGCPGSTAVARIDRCSCSDGQRWGIIEFDFAPGEFDTFDVQILDPAGNVVLPADGTSVISLADGDAQIDLDELPLTYEYLQVSVYAEPNGSDPWSDGDPPSFSIDFATLPALVE